MMRHLKISILLSLAFVDLKAKNENVQSATTITNEDKRQGLPSNEKTILDLGVESSKDIKNTQIYDNPKENSDSKVVVKETKQEEDESKNKDDGISYEPSIRSSGIADKIVESECDFGGVHVTSGSYYTKVGGSDATNNEIDLYIIGFSSLVKCDESNLRLRMNFPGSEDVTIGISSKREYKAPIESGVDYHRFSYFFKISLKDIIKSPCAFNYTIYIGEKKSMRYNFTSHTFCRDNIRVLTFGQHDDSLVGISTIDSGKHYDYDMIILTGNYVSGYHFDDGKLQERYWNSMGPLIAQTMTLFFPGRRESFDNYQMFLSRFMLPGCDENLDCDIAYFWDKRVQIFFLNLDKYILNPQLDRRGFRKRFEAKLAEQQKQMEGLKNWNIVLTNTHFYCSDTSVLDNCITNLFLLKDFEDLFELKEVHVVISSSKMFYESVRNVYNFEIRHTFDHPRNYIISGVAGCNNFITIEDFALMKQLSFKREVHVPSVVSIDIFPEYYKTDLLEIPYFVSRDLRFMSRKFDWGRIFIFAAFLMLLVAILIIFELTDATSMGETAARKHLAKLREQENLDRQPIVA